MTDTSSMVRVRLAPVRPYRAGRRARSAGGGPRNHSMAAGGHERVSSAGQRLQA
ncbi:hypothetical protein ACFFX0_03260 [Citricoccus parietis]|uniref:Uncharacterized protein n=1 Tax=Citricoccus parietis TaxID=592307 RepID=A0ABV5FUA3_9MICC